jgi:hypothetical protein
MPVILICECGKKYKVKEKYQGRTFKCSACGKALTAMPAQALPNPSSQDPLLADSPQSQAVQSEADPLSDQDWEVTISTGERLLLSGKNAVPSLRQHLLAGKVKLGNRCRLHKPAASAVESNDESQRHKTPTEWKTLREYADDEFGLCVLYNPAKAWASRGAMISFFVMIVPVAAACNAFWLVLWGVETDTAFFWGTLLFLSKLTVIGFPFIVILIAKAYSIGALWICMFAVPISLIVSVSAAFAPGYIIGGVLGMTRPKLLK